MKETHGLIIGFQLYIFGFFLTVFLWGMSLLTNICFQILTLEQKHPTDPTRLTQNVLAIIFPRAVFSVIYQGNLISAQNFFREPTLTPLFGFIRVAMSSFTVWAVPFDDTFIVHLVNATQKRQIQNYPLVLSMKPDTFIVQPFRISFFSNYRCKIPDCLGPRHFQHYDVAVPNYDKLDIILRGSRIFNDNCSPGDYAFQLLETRKARSEQSIKLVLFKYMLAGSDAGRSILNGKEYCPFLRQPSNLLRMNYSLQVYFLFQYDVNDFPNSADHEIDYTPTKLIFICLYSVSSMTQRFTEPQRYLPAYVTGQLRVIKRVILGSNFLSILIFSYNILNRKD